MSTYILHSPAAGEKNGYQNRRGWRHARARRTTCVLMPTIVFNTLSIYKPATYSITTLVSYVLLRGLNAKGIGIVNRNTVIMGVPEKNSNVSWKCLFWGILNTFCAQKVFNSNVTASLLWISREPIMGTSYIFKAKFTVGVKTVGYCCT